MKAKNKITKSFERAKNFIRINLWVQKIKIQSFGWFYLFEVVRDIFNSVKGYIEIALFGTIINQLVHYATTSEKDFRLILTPIIFWLGLNLFQNILTVLYNSVQYLYYEFVYGWTVDNLIIRKLQYLDWEIIETPKVEKHLRETSRSRWAMKTLARTHLRIITNIIGFIFAFAVIHLHPVFIILILLKTLPNLIISSKFDVLSYKLNEDLNLSYSTLGNIFSYFRNSKTLFEVKIAAATETLLKKYRDVQQYTFNKNHELDKKQMPYSIAISIYEYLFQAGFYYYYIMKFLAGGIAIGTFQSSINAVDRLSQNITSVLFDISNTIKEFRYVKYNYELLTIENKQTDGTLEFKGNTCEFVFDNISFKYPGTKRYVLKNISVTIKDNTRLALVGENGAGKSTFLKLLTRVHEPTTGEIRLNGIPLCQYKRDSLLKALSFMTQEFATYSVLTARDNITIYESLQDINNINFQNAVKLSTSKEFLEKLPQKYDTLMHKSFEGGTNLSLGQWQRLAVGRQFYANRPLVILDEPTSAIDPIAESTIFNNLYEHVKDKTVIVVSHRYNTVRAAKEILVFKDGQIIERGNHTSLLELNGYYANAFRIQNEEKKL